MFRTEYFLVRSQGVATLGECDSHEYGACNSRGLPRRLVSCSESGNRTTNDLPCKALFLARTQGRLRLKELGKLAGGMHHNAGGPLGLNQKNPAKLHGVSSFVVNREQDNRNPLRPGCSILQNSNHCLGISGVLTFRRAEAT